MAKMMESEFFSATFFHNLAEIESHVRKKLLSVTQHKEHGWNDDDCSPNIKVQDNGTIVSFKETRKSFCLRLIINSLHLHCLNLICFLW